LTVKPYKEKEAEKDNGIKSQQNLTLADLSK
jgi:hypothetical protein